MGMVAVGGLNAHLAYRARDPQLPQQSPHAVLTHDHPLSQQGLVQFYKDQGIIPQSSITPGTRVDDNANVRLTPIVADANIVGITANELNSSNISIYGWSDTNPSAASPYWLLVEDKFTRLVWVASNAISHDDTKITPQNEIANIESLSPVRPYVDEDLLTILGE